ncbi:hypothetical protein [Luteibacter sp. SG786]|uniref:hypothetical protein n=1 Tax=Luteibacter sp. SG786 TaxID=2587130 RepID=UPI0014237BD4|nr:hypothetical protein [Luteibacter sp. SG786]NII54349.1 hypothetical protein [Luteibacter sp. SG786]
MKLKTEVIGNVVLSESPGGMAHDAAAAHALVQAMTTLPEHLSGTNATHWIDWAARRLLSEWGYGEG